MVLPISISCFVLPVIQQPNTAVNSDPRAEARRVVMRYDTENFSAMALRSISIRLPLLRRRRIHVCRHKAVKNLSSIVAAIFQEQSIVYSDRTKVGHVIQDVCRVSRTESAPLPRFALSVKFISLPSCLAGAGPS